MRPVDRRAAARFKWIRPVVTALSFLGLLSGVVYVLTQYHGVKLLPYWQLGVSMYSGPRHSCSLAADKYRVADIKIGDKRLPLTMYVSSFDDEISASVLNCSAQGSSDLDGHTHIYRFYDSLCGAVEVGKCQGLVVDVGAYIGTHALYLATLGFEVHAFEPMRASADLLRCSVAANSLGSNLHVVGKAASDRNGSDCLLHPPDSKRQTTLVAPHGADCSSLPELQTEVVKLDTYWADVLHKRPVLLLKIDAEGHEDHVLAGAAQLLSSSSPPPPRFILLEYYPEMLTLKGVALPDFFNRIFRAGYRVHDCQQGAEVPRMAEGLDTLAVYKERQQVTNLLLAREADFPEEVPLPKWVCGHA